MSVASPKPSNSNRIRILLAMLKSAGLMFLCSVIITVAAAQGRKARQNKENSVAAFSVAGEPVSVDEFVYLYRKNHQNKDEDFTQQKIDEYLNLFINFKLKVHEARMRGMDTVASFHTEYNSYKNELRKPYLPDSKLADSLVKLTYERMRYEVKASHILITVKPDALPADTLKAYNKILAIRNSILAGEDFSTAAEAYSEDPSAKVNRGNLGYFTAMQMVYPFETAAYETAPGEITMPVRTKFGYHILKVFDKRAAQGEVEVSHIMIRTGDDRDNVKAKNTIFTVYDELQAGVRWEDLCKEYSEDPATRDNGGRLRPIGTGAMAAVPEFEAAAFGLQSPGDISDPVQTRYGWHIIRLEKKLPLPSFQEMEASLKNRVLRDERTTLSKQALQDKLRKEYRWEENQNAKMAMLAASDSSLNEGNWNPPLHLNSTEPLFSLKGKGYSVGEFLSYVQRSQKPNKLPFRGYMEQLYNNFVDASILKLVEDRIVSENPTYSYLLKEYYEGILLFEIMEREVWNKASEDSTGQRAYYDSHISAYMAGERANSVLYSSKAPDFSAPLKEIIASGEEDKIQEFVGARKIKVETGIYQKDEKSVLQKIPWEKGVYAAENNGIYYLAWLKDILPPGPMSFEESRSHIISDYQAYLEETWIDQLKQKYTVKVNEKGKKYILQQLQEK